MANKTPFDIIRDAFERERLGSRLVEAVEEIDRDGLRQFADQLSEICDGLERLADELAAIEDAYGRDERANARDNALGALDDFVGTLNALEDLPADLVEEINRPVEVCAECGVELRTPEDWHKPTCSHY